VFREGERRLRFLSSNRIVFFNRKGGPRRHKNGPAIKKTKKRAVRGEKELLPCSKEVFTKGGTLGLVESGVRALWNKKKKKKG